MEGLVQLENQASWNIAAILLPLRLHRGLA